MGLPVAKPCHSEAPFRRNPFLEAIPFRRRSLFGGNMDERWYALQVYTGRENAVSQWMTAFHLRTLLLTYQDRRQWCDRVHILHVPLFKGYLLCQFDYASRAKILAVPGVQKIVGFGGIPTPVDPKEITELLKLKDSPLPV